MYLKRADTPNKNITASHLACHQTQPPLHQLSQDLSSMPNIEQISEQTSKRNPQENKQNQLNKNHTKPSRSVLEGLSATSSEFQ